MNAETLIALSHVEKRYGKDTVLEIAKLDFQRGAHVLITGANGSGKSTLLRVCARISQINRGQVWWAPSIATTGFGFVPQHGGLYPDRSVAQNVRTRQQLFGVDDERSASSSFEALGLSALTNKPVKTLSGGFQRLAAVAVALSVRPRVLFLDEPFTGLDSVKTAALAEYLECATLDMELMIIASPSAAAVISVASRININEGKIA